MMHGRASSTTPIYLSTMLYYVSIKHFCISNTMKNLQLISPPFAKVESLGLTLKREPVRKTSVVQKALDPRVRRLQSQEKPLEEASRLMPP